MDVLESSPINEGVEHGHDPSDMDPILEAAANLGAAQQPQGDPYLVVRRQDITRWGAPGKEPSERRELQEGGYTQNPSQSSDEGTLLLSGDGETSFLSGDGKTSLPSGDGETSLQSGDGVTPEVSKESDSDGSMKFNVDLRDRTDRRERGHYPVDGPKNIFIFNFEKIKTKNKKEMCRKGSDKDLANLESVFQQTGYNVEPYKDLNKENFFCTLQEISQREKLAQSKIFVLVVMSHGNITDGQHFLTSDGEHVSIDTVRTRFNDKHCPLLKGKPKIFLGAFCRRLQKNARVNIDDASANSADLTPSEAVQTQSGNVGLPETDFRTRAHLNDLAEVGQVLKLLEECSTQSEIEQAMQGVNPDVARALSELTSPEGCDASSNFDHDDSGKHNDEIIRTDLLAPLEVRPKDFNDMMTLYSCKKGYRSVRKIGIGSRFITAFCSVVSKHGWEYNLDRLYSEVEIMMAEKCPEDDMTMEGYAPDKESRTFKTCYLF